MTEEQLDIKIAEASIERIMVAAKNATLDKLLPQEKNYIEKLDWANSISRTHPSASDKTIVNLIKDHFKCDIRTAEKVWQHTRYFRSPEYRATKRFERDRLTQMLRDDMEQVQKLIDTNKYKYPMVAIEGFKAKVKLVEKIEALNKYAEDDEVLETGNKNITFKFTTDPRVLPNITTQSIKELDATMDKIITRKLKKEDAQYLEYTEVKK
jgi:hypothetical protein